jgi:hypothetical protein
MGVIVKDRIDNHRGEFFPALLFKPGNNIKTPGLFQMEVQEQYVRPGRFGGRQQRPGLLTVSGASRHRQRPDPAKKPARPLRMRGWSSTITILYIV